MKKLILLFVSILLLQLNGYSQTPLNGTYTIGGVTSDFNTFNDAVTSLHNNGVNGPVVFNVQPGTYTGQYTFNEVSGASANSTITFQSANGDSTSVILINDTSYRTIKLVGADYFRFSNITFTANGQSASAIELSSGACYNEFLNNIISCDSVSCNAASLIYEFDSLNSHNTFRNNRLENGEYGFYCSGPGHINHTNNYIIENNEIINSSITGIYMEYIDSILIVKNFISGKSNNGVELKNCNDFEILKNRIFLNNINKNQTGILVNNSSGLSSDHSSLVNNFVSVVNYYTYSSGISIEDGDYIDVFNNSVNINVFKGSIAISGLHLSSVHFVYIHNNILNSVNAGVAFEVSGSLIYSDYNNFNALSSLINYNGTTYTNIVDYQQATSKDLNSISVDPAFVSDTNLYTNQFDLNSSAIPLQEVPDDIDGNPRDTIKPDIGAVEFDIFSTDAGIISIDEPSNIISNGINDIKASLRNFGSNTLSSVVIEWTINNIPQNPYYWYGSLLPGDTIPQITVGLHNFTDFRSDIKAWTENPNGQLDDHLTNDSSEVSILVCKGPLNGIYYVGGLNSEFPTITDAVNNLIQCGINGPVTFNINPGTYVEQLFIPSISGSSSTNTICFQSSTADSTDVIITNDSSSVNFSYLIKLDSTEYITFKYLSFVPKPVHGQPLTRIIYISSNSDHITFTNNIFEPTYFFDINNSFALVIRCGNTLIKNNFINNTDGIDCGGEFANHTEGVIIEGNHICNGGIGLGFCDNIEVVSNKIEILTKITKLAKTAIHVGPCDGMSNVSKNIIISTDKNLERGIVIDGCYGTSGFPGLISNNFVYIRKHGSPGNNLYGIYNDNSDYQNYYNNSVYLDTDSLTFSNAFLVNSPSIAHSINAVNNTFSTGNGHTYWASNPVKVTISDYNNLYTTGQNFAMWGNDPASNLQELQQLSGKDINSVSVDPGFVAPPDLHLLTADLNGLGTPLASVPEDIDGDMRDPVTPDIGADEYTPVNNDIGLIVYIQPMTNFDTIGSLKNVEVVIKNFGTSTASNFDVVYQIIGSPMVLESYPGILQSLQTDTFLFSTPYITGSGQFELKAYTSMLGDQIPGNDTITKILIGNTVIQIPFMDDFESKGTSSLWQTPGINNQWEVGTPTANTINYAHSGSKVFATILDNSYYNNRSDALYSPIFDLAKIGVTTIKFWHWIWTEKYYDGGYIEYLNNLGDWNLLGTKDDPHATNWYNTFAANKYLWSGHSNGWTYSTYDLSYLTDLGNITQFRFVFTSNIINNDDGWAIDDFSFGFPYVLLDVGVNKIVAPIDTTLPGSNVSVTVEIINFGIDTMYSIPVSYIIDGGSSITETWNGILIPYASETFTFTNQFVPPGSPTYAISSFTGLSNDAYLLNDTIHKVIINNANYLIEDIGIEEITNPIDTTIFGTSIPVKVLLRNYGTKTVFSTLVSYSIDGGIPVHETWVGTLNPNDADTFMFSNQYYPPNDSLYKFCTYCTLGNDVDNSNDTICLTLINKFITGIETHKESGFWLGQNIPNPANNITRIYYSIPNSGKTFFRIMNLYGQIVYSRNQEHYQGVNLIEFDVARFKSGIYYYSIEYKGRRLTKKMIITD